MERKTLWSALVVAVVVAGLTATAAAGAAARGPSGGPGDRGAAMFDRVDTNDDGVITREEFDAMHEQRFTMMDQDGDGQITMDEAQDAHQQMKQQHRANMKGGGGPCGGSMGPQGGKVTTQ